MICENCGSDMGEPEYHDNEIVYGCPECGLEVYGEYGENGRDFHPDLDDIPL